MGGYPVEISSLPERVRRDQEHFRCENLRKPLCFASVMTRNSLFLILNLYREETVLGDSYSYSLGRERQETGHRGQETGKMGWTVSTKVTRGGNLI